MADSDDAQYSDNTHAAVARQPPPPPPPPVAPPLSAARLLLWLLVAAAVPVMVALLGVFARYLQASERLRCLCPTCGRDTWHELKLPPLRLEHWSPGQRSAVVLRWL